MSQIKSFIESESRKTKALAIAMRSDPISTGLEIAIQLLAFGIGVWFVILAAKWSFNIITSAI